MNHTMDMWLEEIQTVQGECGSCCKEFTSDGKMKEAVEEAKEQGWKLASSKKYEMIGFICPKCFSDPQEDWILNQKM